MVSYSFVNKNTGMPLNKHLRFYDAVLAGAAGQTDKRIFHFGGGVNGGKTYTCLLCLAMLCWKYPKSRYHVVRKNYPALTKTTIESAKKLFGKTGTWNMSATDMHFKFRNGSRIHFIAESYHDDKEFTKFLGLETNGFLLEQIEELNEGMFQIAKQRAGRWKIAGERMPTPLILTSFNPTPIKWVRDLVYLPSLTTIPNDTYIEFVTVMDNPFATLDELEMLKSMDTKHYNQFVLGSWEEFTSTKTFCYNFKKDKHVRDITSDVFTDLYERDDLYLSFDFNVNPMTCVIASISNDKLYILKEFRQENSDIFKICDEIKEYINNIAYNYIYVTGDSSGFNRNGLTNYTYYDVILQKFGLNQRALKITRRNLTHHESRLVCNYVLEKLDFAVNPDCVYLIQDMQLVEADEKGHIDKSNTSITHLLDCFRYICNNFFINHIDSRYLKL